MNRIEKLKLAADASIVLFISDESIAPSNPIAARPKTSRRFVTRD